MSHIIWEGPSQINGAPIIGVVTDMSANSKLTDRLKAELLQLWILPGDMHPKDVIATGADESVCGSCPLRSFRDGQKVERLCYVSPKPISSVYRGLAKARRVSPEEAVAGSRARLLRLGAWGDPTALPYDVVRRLSDAALAAGIKRRAGYTHRYAVADQRWRELIMASCEGTLQAMHAQLMGWRTFTIVPPDTAPGGEHITCPASEEGGHKATCEKCGLCDGARPGGDLRSSIQIAVHGVHRTRKELRFAELLANINDRIILENA